MSDERALLAAIWEHPHEDTPRLMYADWLQENGQPERAEFIRVQCDLARFGEWNDSPRKLELGKLAELLWKKHGETWRAGLPSPFKKGMFHRGFPHPPEQSVTGKQFLAFSEIKLNAAPIWTFNLRETTALTIAQMAQSRVLSRTEKWMLWTPSREITPSILREFVSSPNARNLSTLGLRGQKIGDAGVRVFARNAELPHLTALYLDEAEISDEGIDALSDWSGAERLQKLWISGNALHDESLALIATGPLGRGLKSLLIGGNPGITTAGLIRLIESPAADSLASLNLVGSTVMPEVVEAIAMSPRSRALRQLILDATRLGDREITVLLDSPHLRNLQYLTVRGSDLRPGGKVAKRLDAEFGGGNYGSGVGGWRTKRSE